MGVVTFKLKAPAGGISNVDIEALDGMPSKITLINDGDSDTITFLDTGLFPVDISGVAPAAGNANIEFSGDVDPTADDVNGPGPIAPHPVILSVK